MSYEIETVLEYLQECIGSYYDSTTGKFVETLSYNGQDVVRLLRRMSELYDQGGEA